MINIPEGSRRRSGFAMLLLAIAAASICTVTVSSQSAGTVYETQAIRQLMRNEQARWLAEGFSELGLASECAPFAGPPAPLFGMPVQSVLRDLGYSVGDSADSNSTEVMVVRGSPNFGSSGNNPLDQDVEVRIHGDTAASSPPMAEREISVSRIPLEPDDAGGMRVATFGNQVQSGWILRDSNRIP